MKFWKLVENICIHTQTKFYVISQCSCYKDSAQSCILGKKQVLVKNKIAQECSDGHNTLVTLRT